jgi:hypothetical protein
VCLLKRRCRKPAFGNSLRARRGISAARARSIQPPSDSRSATGLTSGRLWPIARYCLADRGFATKRHRPDARRSYEPGTPTGQGGRRHPRPCPAISRDIEATTSREWLQMR